MLFSLLFKPGHNHVPQDDVIPFVQGMTITQLVQFSVATLLMYDIGTVSTKIDILSNIVYINILSDSHYCRHGSEYSRTPLDRSFIVTPMIR